MTSDQPRHATIPERTLQSLIAKVKEASQHAYCPYSKFRVGAALLTLSEHIFSGCNFENASFRLTICAERNAVFQMVAQAKQRIKALVVYTPTQKPTAPCRACRQIISEFGPKSRVISVCEGPEKIDTTLDKLTDPVFWI